MIWIIFIACLALQAVLIFGGAMWMMQGERDITEGR